MACNINLCVEIFKKKIIFKRTYFCFILVNFFKILSPENEFSIKEVGGFIIFYNNLGHREDVDRDNHRRNRNWSVTTEYEEKK